MPVTLLTGVGGGVAALVALATCALLARRSNRGKRARVASPEAAARRPSEGKGAPVPAQESDAPAREPQPQPQPQPQPVTAATSAAAAARIRRESTSAAKVDAAQMPSGHLIARGIFAQFDKDRSGSIDAAELRELVSRSSRETLSEDELQRAMAVLDRDSSGTIGEAEFYRWWDMGLSVLAFKGDGGLDARPDEQVAAVAQTSTKRRRKKTGAAPASEPKAPDCAQGGDEAAPVAEHDYNARENNPWSQTPAAAPLAQATSEPAASPATSLAAIAGAASVAETTKKRRKKRAPADDAVRV